MGIKGDLRKIVMLASLLASVLMLVGKLAAYFLTTSIAVLSDASESLVHGFATGLAVYALWYAERPADEGHPYGHGRIVYLSAGFEGALILLTALFVIVNGVRALLVGSTLSHLDWGIGITAVLGLINLALGLLLVRIGRRRNALVLIANGKHVLSDMWTSLGAVAGLLLVRLTGLRWLDALTGVAVGLWILATAIALLRRAVGGLMDQSDPQRTRALVDCLEQAVSGGDLVGYHQLRHRRVNDQVWVEVHLLVPGSMPTEQAHRIATVTEDRLRAALEHDRVWVTSHVEPAEHSKAHPRGHEGPDPLDKQRSGDL